jgi:hypothetical protein
VSTTPDATIEETWWEVTTTTGLILQLPAPLTSGGAPRPPAQCLDTRVPVSSSSTITGFSYALSLETVFAIRVFVRSQDPERLARSKARLIASETSLPSGPDRESRSAAPVSRSGRSIGGTTKPRTH